MSRLLRTVSGYALGVVAGSLLFGGLSFASTGVKSISAHFANIAIRVSGKTIKTSAEPFIFNHNVYVPISTIGHGLGAKVAWNGTKRDVVIVDTNLATIKQGELNYYNLPVYSGTHTVTYDGQSYVAGFALATILNEPFYIAPNSQTLYIGQGPSTGMPLSSFYDTRDYGDYAKLNHGVLGPDYGWSDGAPVIDKITYPNDSSLVWAPQSSGSSVPGVEYNLNGQYTSITGAFGLDDSTTGKDLAQLTIMGDGKELYQSPWMAQGEAATPVSVNVASVKLITVEFALKAGTKTYEMGQAVPNGGNVDVDFVDVSVH